MSRRPTPVRGDIWDAYLDPPVGREQGGRRPVLVISNDHLNLSTSQLCVIVPITTRDRGVPAHPSLSPGEGGLERPSFMLCDQVRSISHERLRHFRGRVSPETVGHAIEIVSVLLEELNTDDRG